MEDNSFFIINISNNLEIIKIIFQEKYTSFIFHIILNVIDFTEKHIEWFYFGFNIFHFLKSEDLKINFISRALTEIPNYLITFYYKNEELFNDVKNLNEFQTIFELINHGV